MPMGNPEEREGRAVAYLAEVDFIEDDLVRVADAPESGDEGQQGDDDEDGLVVALGARGGFGGGSLHQLVELDVGGGTRNTLLRLLGRDAAGIPLAQSALGRRCCGHGGETGTQQEMS